jgi:hypothetical protein
MNVDQPVDLMRDIQNLNQNHVQLVYTIEMNINLRQKDVLNIYRKDTFEKY